MLPKVIHYCWFGESDIPEDYKTIIAEWELLHPGWTIKRWDESNAPMSLPYIKTAREHNNWANISNYVRFYALGREGGIYLDTDMKVLKPLDELLSNDCFLGFESGSEGSNDFWVNNAIMGATAGHPFISECEQYLLAQFDGTEQANLSSPQLVTAVLKDKYNLQQYGRQSLGDVMLYEKEVFYPIPVDKAYLLKEINTYPEETIAVHLWGRTWFTNEMLITEMDQLRRHAHDLIDYNERILKELKQSQVDLQMTNNRLNEAQLENTELKGLIKDSLLVIKDSLLKIESSLENTSGETDRRFNELIACIKDLSRQQELMHQQQTELNTLFQKEFGREGLWSIAKRKLLKFK